MYGGIKKIEDNIENDFLFLKMFSVFLMVVFLWLIGLSVVVIVIFEFVKFIKEYDVIFKEILIKKGCGNNKRKYKS